MMVTVESSGPLERRMRVELPAERIENEIESRLKSFRRTAKLKGFRPGKVPASVVKQRFGGQIRQEVLSDLMQKSYSDAVAQENLKPAGNPTIEPDPNKDSKAFAYVATFEVLPEVTLKGLDKITVEQPDVQIGDDDCDDMLTNLRQQKATWNKIDRASKEGDRVIVDFDGTLKGEPIQGGKGADVPVVLGQGQMLPDFEKALHGVKAGDEKTFKVTFPKDYHAEELSGQKVEFASKVHRVEEQELPPLDDDLATMFGVAEGGLERLKKDVVENMEREAKQKVRQDTKEQVMNGLLVANPIDVPKALTDQEMHTMQHEAMRQLGIEDHDKAPPRENFAEGAEKRVRIGLLLRQYIQDNALKVDSDRLRERIEDMCGGYENAPEMVANYLSNPQIVAQIEPMVLEEQAIDLLIQNGVEKVKKVVFKEYMNR
jgi:trigger factor